MTHRRSSSTWEHSTVEVVVSAVSSLLRDVLASFISLRIAEGTAEVIQERPGFAQSDWQVDLRQMQRDHGQMGRDMEPMRGDVARAEQRLRRECPELSTAAAP